MLKQLLTGKQNRNNQFKEPAPAGFLLIATSDTKHPHARK